MTAERSRGASSLGRIESILANPELYALANAIPTPEPTAGGRPRDYPAAAVVLFEALISVYGSARQVEAEIAHPLVWRLIRAGLHRHGGLRVGLRPMRRHHYLYLRNTYMTDPEVLAALERVHREHATAHAREVGILDPNGTGSWTHPNRSRLLYGDGKVLTPCSVPAPATPGSTSGPASSSPSEPRPTPTCTSRAPATSPGAPSG